MTDGQRQENGADRPEARAAARRPAMAPSTLRARGIAATDVTVIDLSLTGVRIAAETALGIGDEISIGLSGLGTRRAYVAWRRDGQYGCAFAQTLEPHEVAHAFTSASVVRLGTSAQVDRAVQTNANATLQDLYDAPAPWRLPWDAWLTIAGYAALAGWIAWRLWGR